MRLSRLTEQPCSTTSGSLPHGRLPGLLQRRWPKEKEGTRTPCCSLCGSSRASLAKAFTFNGSTTRRSLLALQSRGARQPPFGALIPNCHSLPAVRSTLVYLSTSLRKSSSAFDREGTSDPEPQNRANVFSCTERYSGQRDTLCPGRPHLRQRILLLFDNSVVIRQSGFDLCFYSILDCTCFSHLWLLSKLF